MSVQWPLVFFTLFVGLGCGTFISSVVLAEWYGKARQIRTKSSLLALAALVVGGIASTLHLGHPSRIFGALAHPTSGIFMESTLILLLAIAILIYLLALRRDAAESTGKMVASIGAILALVLIFVNGHTYVMASIPAWNTLVLPALYVVSALVMGCFSVGLLLVGTEAVSKTGQTTGSLAETAATTETVAAISLINRAALAVLALQALLIIAYLIHVSGAPYPDATRSAARIITGNLALLFWGGMVLLGLVIPAAITVKLKGKNAQNRPGQLPVLLGLFSVVLGAVAFRALMFLIGSSVRQFF